MILTKFSEWGASGTQAIPTDYTPIKITVFLRWGGGGNREVVGFSGTRDKAANSGTVPEIPGQLEPMY